MTAIAYTFPIDTAPGSPLVLVPQAPSRAAVYRRRRVAVASVAILAAFGLGVLLDSAVTAIAARNAQPALIATTSAAGPVTWTVQAGDTLWSIATATHPGQDPRPIVAQMQSNGGSADLQLGDVITVP